MKKFLFIFLLFIPLYAHAGGPGMPEGYRMPSEQELSLPERNSDKYRYVMAPGDFNGDGLIDGAFLAVNDDKKEVALYAFLCTDKDQVYKWYKLESFEYESIKFTGIRLIRPQTISFYPDINDEKKQKLRIVHDSLELFQFEGSRSVFYYEPKSEKFERIWTSK